MSATLPLYDLPELQAATDAWWAAIAAALGRHGVPGVPAALTRGPDVIALWGDVGLVFAQICGYPLQRWFADRLLVVATPCVRARGCVGPTYRSLLVVPASSQVSSLEALRGARCAVNEPASHSGMNALRGHLARHARDGRFFGEVSWSGSHRRSLELLAAGDVDLAAIDCITYALLGKIAPTLIAASRVIGETEPAPGPPYVIPRRAAEARPRVLAALREVMADPGLADVRDALLLDDVELLTDEDYHGFLTLEADAARLGYPEVG